MYQIMTVFLAEMRKNEVREESQLPPWKRMTPVAFEMKFPVPYSIFSQYGARASKQKEYLCFGLMGLG